MKLKSYGKDKKEGSSTITAARTYNPAADSLLGETPAAPVEEGRSSKKQKRAREVVEAELAEEKSETLNEDSIKEGDGQQDIVDTVSEKTVEVAAPSKKEKKQKKKVAELKVQGQEEEPVVVETKEVVTKTKKRKGHVEEVEVTETETIVDGTNGSVKKSKKKGKKVKVAPTLVGLSFS